MASAIQSRAGLVSSARFPQFSSTSPRSSSASTARLSSDQLCRRMIRASLSMSEGTWSFTPPVATRYMAGLPIRSPSTNVGMPSASSRIRAGATARLSANLVSVTHSIGRSPRRLAGEAGSSEINATSCFGQIAPTFNSQRDSQMSQYPRTSRTSPHRAQRVRPGTSSAGWPQVGQKCVPDPGPFEAWKIMVSIHQRSGAGRCPSGPWSGRFSRRFLSTILAAETPHAQSIGVASTSSGLQRRSESSGLVASREPSFSRMPIRECKATRWILPDRVAIAIRLRFAE